MDLGQKIAQARKAAGMTQEELAAALHVTRTTISSWERGRTQPDLDSIRLLSGILRCDFLSGDAEGKPEQTPPQEMQPEAPAPAGAAKSRPLLLIIGASALVLALALCFILFILPAISKGNKGGDTAAADPARTPETGMTVRLGPTDLPGAVQMEPEDLPLKEPELFTIEWFKQDNPVASGEPYIEFRTKLSIMGPETSSSGVTIWDWDLLFYEMTGRPFTLTKVDEYGFSSRESYQHYSYRPGNLWYEDGPDAHWEFGGRMPVQPFQGYGYIIYGTDEAGNELSFRTWFDLSTAPKK